MPLFDNTCKYSRLKIVINRAVKLGVHKVCVTFDQPLWLKAITILKSENLPIVCRLGGFHILMTHEYYWKCKERNLMKGSGFEELLFLNI